MLTVQDLHPDPFVQFERWLEAAKAASLRQPLGMTLATVGPEGRPSARVVLLRGFDARGLVFYTNYTSRKSRDLEARPWGALTFWWPELDRQVRIEGRVERTRPEESDAYWRSRPRGSQITAWISDQSTVVAGEEVLRTRAAELERQRAGREIPRPPHWGGFRLLPDTFEFWQEGIHRLHDRFLYWRPDGQPWKIERLAP